MKVWWVAVVAVVGCGGRSADGPALISCVPGTQISCACPSGKASVQVCAEDAVFDACLCDSSVSVGSGGSGPTGQPGGDTGVMTGYAGSASTVGGTTGSAGAGGAAVINYGYGQTAPCLQGGDALFLSGDAGDYIHPGQDLIRVGEYNVTPSAAEDTVEFQITPSGQQHGLFWWPTFSSEKIGKPLAVGEYLNAERWPFETYLEPGLDVSGDGRGCNMLSGKFVITDIAWRADTLLRLTVAFEQHCELGPSALRGCLHYEAPDSGAGGQSGADGAAGAGAASGDAG